MQIGRTNTKTYDWSQAAMLHQTPIQFFKNRTHHKIYQKNENKTLFKTNEK